MSCEGEETAVEGKQDYEAREEAEANDDEEEPLLKYERMGGSLPEIFKVDKVTCMHSNGKFLVILSDMSLIDLRFEGRWH